MSEHPEFYQCSRSKARKPHKCCECRGVINAREVYFRHSGKWDGVVETFTMCSECDALMDELNEGRRFDEKTTFGGLLEDCSETGDEWLLKLVAIMAKRRASIPEWAAERLAEAEVAT